MLPADRQVVAVTQSGQQIKRLPRHHIAHLRGAFAHYFVYKRQASCRLVHVTDRDRAAQEQPVQPDVYELPGAVDRAGCRGQIALQHHFADRLTRIGRQKSV